MNDPVYINSPGYPTKPYGNDIKCVWNFQNDKIPNILTFQLLDLDTEQDADFVEVRNEDKDGFLLGKYSGNTIGNKAVVTTTESSMWVKFQSDFEDNRKGFRAIVRPGTYYSACKKFTMFSILLVMVICILSLQYIFYIKLTSS